MRFRLMPSDEHFYELFDRSADNVADAAKRLRAALNGDEPDFSGIKACERKGDELTRELLLRLSSSFVTPFDREDIHALAEELDDVVDDIFTVSELIQLSRPTTPLPELTEQADLLVRMTEETQALVATLNAMSGAKPHLDAIDALESEGDAVYRRIVSRLLSGEVEAIEVLRWRGIVDAMEAALNTIEDISDVVESIILKHA